MFSHWYLSDSFFIIRLWLRALGKETTEVKCGFHHVSGSSKTSRFILSTWLTTEDVNCDHLAQVSFVRFLHCEISIFFLTFHTVILKGNCYAQPALTEWGVMLHLP